MLSINDYEHLKLLYDKFFKKNKQIRSLIIDGEFESADFAIQEKDSLIRQILLFEKPRINEIKNNSVLYEMRLKLIELEKENIVLVKGMKDKLMSELTSIKKTKKIINAYEPKTNDTVSTFEVYEE